MEGYRRLEEENVLECEHPDCGVRFATRSISGEPKEPNEAELIQHRESHKPAEAQ